MTKQAWLEEVLSWDHTPFRWQGRVKGDGSDCWGLVVGACRNVGYIPKNWDVRVYQRRDNLVAMWHDIAPQWFDRVDVIADMQPGDIVVWHRGAGIVHLGVLYDHPTQGLGLIHCEDWQRIMAHAIPQEHHAKITEVWRPRFEQ